MRVFVVDFGGTRLKWGLFSSEELERKGVLSSQVVYSVRDFKEFLRGFSLIGWFWDLRVWLRTGWLYTRPIYRIGRV